MTNDLAYSISLERLNLKSFRCFSDLEIDFDKRLTVFIAENGGGKTTVLDAIAECLKVYLTALKVSGYKSNLIASKDVKIGETYANCSLLVDIDYISFSDGFETPNNALTSLTVTTSEEEQKIQLTSDFYQQAKPLKKDTDKGKDIAYPVLVYYGGNSVPVVYINKEKTNLDRINMVYKGALSSERLHFTTFFNWWKGNEDRMLRASDKTSSQFRTFNDQFTKLKRAIEFILNEDTNNSTYTDLRINDELKMVMDKKTHDGGPITVEISQFSSGEKALFAFVADLGLRLLHATPLAVDIDADHAYKILGKGIVLIDEVDLHLHLLWQQKVIDKLMEIFPEVQFVMTTHSLLVLGKLRSDNVRLFVDNDLYSIPEMYGQDIGTIIEKIWKIPSNIFKPRIREVYRLIATNVLDNILAAKAEVESIEKEIGNSTPALIEAQTIIKYKEKALMR